MRWYDKYPSVSDLELTAWAHMINDPFMTVYTFENGREHRRYVNPELAFKRMSIGMANSMMAVRDKLQSELAPALENFAKALEPFINSVKHIGLDSSFPNSDTV